MDCTFPLSSAKNARAASSSSGASSLPSYSNPPPMTALFAQIKRMSSGQSTIGGTPTVAGAPMRKRPILSQILALDDGVGALRGAQHGLADLAAVDLRLPKQRLHRADDAFKDVSRGGVLDLGDDAQIFVDEDGVGIGAAYVDAQLIHFPHLP